MRPIWKRALFADEFLGVGWHGGEGVDGGFVFDVVAGVELGLAVEFSRVGGIAGVGAFGGVEGRGVDLVPQEEEVLDGGFFVGGERFGGGD